MSSAQTVKDSKAGMTVVNVSGNKTGVSTKVNLSDKDYVQATSTASKPDHSLSNG